MRFINLDADVNRDVYGNDEKIEELKFAAFSFGIDRSGYAWRVAGKSGHLRQMLLNVLELFLV